MSAPSDKNKCAGTETCSIHGLPTKLASSGAVALVTFVTYLIIASPVMYKFTSLFLGTGVNRLPSAARAMVPLGVVPNWWGYVLHAIVAALVGYGLGLLMMNPFSKEEKCCCIIDPEVIK